MCVERGREKERERGDTFAFQMPWNTIRKVKVCSTKGTVLASQNDCPNCPLYYMWLKINDIVFFLFFLFFFLSERKGRGQREKGSHWWFATVVPRSCESKNVELKRTRAREREREGERIGRRVRLHPSFSVSGISIDPVACQWHS